MDCSYKCIEFTVQISSCSFQNITVKNKVATSTSRKLEIVLFLEYKKNIYK